MKKILIPTDFSAIADNATTYAIELADAFRSKILLYHVYAMKKSDYDLNYSDKQQPFVKRIEKSMKKTKVKFDQIIEEKNLSIKTKTYQGNIFSLFKRTVKKDGVDLVVMGSKGASGLKKVIFGSIASSALDMVQVPLLVIPPKQTYRPLKNIVLTSDSKDISSVTLLPLEKLARKFGAKITILTVNKNSDKYLINEKSIDLGEVKTIYKEVTFSNSINESINKFIKKEKPDMLCMVRRKKSFFKSIFKKSITKSQAYNNKIPLLILPE